MESGRHKILMWCRLVHHVCKGEISISIRRMRRNRIMLWPKIGYCTSAQNSVERFSLAHGQLQLFSIVLPFTLSVAPTSLGCMICTDGRTSTIVIQSGSTKAHSYQVCCTSRPQGLSILPKCLSDFPPILAPDRRTLKFSPVPVLLK